MPQEQKLIFNCDLGSTKTSENWRQIPYGVIDFSRPGKKKKMGEGGEIYIILTWKWKVIGEWGTCSFQ